ncbi:hypothetical protein GCM10009037_05440 [Halarchaeum grantii]|uniref:Lipoprotein n=1 Tax=Halarchaeum grantii TaxID=1193105 RepID=A0A830ESF4_9EURY|nr:hypothetical protein [Halarchaeum grantii]GGL24831.1 hypothetical protein GCM10009037_05440 [Halarchaeum grantii]
MQKNALAALAVVALVALAGCSAMSGGGGQPYETPVNGSQMEAQHASALEEAGSFTYHLTVNASSAETTSTTQDLTAKVDLDSGAYALSTSSAFGDATVYADGNGTAYTRINSSTGVLYRQGSAFDVDATQFSRLGAENLTERANVTYEGTSTLDGETVHTYVAHVNASAGADASGTVGGLSAEASANATARFDVRPDGLVKRVHYTVNASQRSVDVTMRYTDVGSTDPTPPWLDAARANTTAETATN